MPERRPDDGLQLLQRLVTGTGVTNEFVENGHLTLHGTDAVAKHLSWLASNIEQELFIISRVGRTGGLQFSDMELLRPIARKVASSNIRATHLLIFDSVSDLYSRSTIHLMSLMSEQADAGVWVGYVLATDLSSQEYSSGLAIWDDRLVSQSPTPEDPRIRLDVLGDPTSLESARQAKVVMQGLARPYATLRDEYMLAASSLETRGTARDLCRTPRSGTSCAAYHGSWQFLRLLGLVESARDNEVFFSRYLKQLAIAKKSMNILVCGLADFAMLEVVLEALQPTADAHALTVIDACPTPIQVVNKFLTSRSPTNAVEAMVRRAEDTGFPDEAFDLVVTDALLSKIPYEAQSDVVSEWHRILRSDGGELLTTIRISDDQTPMAVKASVAQARNFAGKAFARAHARSFPSLQFAPFPVSPEEASNLAYEYAFQNETYPVPMANLSDLFPGFDVEIVEQIPFEEYSLGRFVRIIATRDQA